MFTYLAHTYTSSVANIIKVLTYAKIEAISQVLNEGYPGADLGYAGCPEQPKEAPVLEPV